MDLHLNLQHFAPWLFLAASPAFLNAQDLRIAEFMASNSATLEDEDATSPDWIELENVSQSPVNLAGWRLTDDAANPSKWTFPSKVLAAGARIVVFASGKNKINPAANLHTNFSLSAGGEYLGLFPPAGAAATEFAPSYPAQTVDVSYGFPTGGGAAAWMEPATPGAPNGPGAQLMEPIQFSTKRGIHTAPFNLSLSCATPGARIRYTLDGTEPSPTNGSPFSAPIPINKSTTVRAVAYLAGGASIAKSVTSTYIFPTDVIQQSQAGAVSKGFPASWIEADGTPWTVTPYGPHPDAWYGMDSAITSLYTPQQLEDALRAIPIVSVVMPIADWFGYNPPLGPFGIYANSEEESDEWDRKASMEFIDPSGGPEVQANCGIAIQGGSSTSAYYRAQLSMSLKFKSGLGEPKLEFPIFPGSPIQRFDRLVLDGGNQDGIYSQGGPAAMNHHINLRDRFAMDLQLAMGGTTSRARYVHLFLNGLYWGVYSLHERPDENWAPELFGGEDHHYDWVKENGVYEGNNNGVNTATPGAWHVATAIAQSGVGAGATYQGQNAYALLQEYIHLDDYIDYLILNFYLGNNDWPDHNWMATARARVGPALSDVNPDLIFRFHSWDAEHSMFWDGFETLIGDGYYDQTGVNWTFAGPVTYFHSRLRQNPEYVVKFGDRVHRHLFHGGALHVQPGYNTSGTVFDPAHPERNRPASLLHKAAKEMEGAVPLQYARWANYFYTPGLYKPAVWFTERNRLLHHWAAIRSDVLLAQLRNSGLYPQLDAPTFSQQGGFVVPGYLLSMTAPAGATVYFTTDGSDPRLPGGALSPTAQLYTGSVVVSASTTFRARSLQANQWSALNEGVFYVEFALRVSEFMADNTSTAQDEANDFEDWIELVNLSPIALPLDGVHMSDNAATPLKWAMPAGTVIEPGERLMIWCDEEPTEGPFHAAFKLSKSGESVVLTLATAGGNVTLDQIAFGAQVTNASSGRIPEAANSIYTIFDPTPGASNVPGPGETRRYDAAAWSTTVSSLSFASPAQLGTTLLMQISGAPANAQGAVFFGSDTGLTTVPGLGPLLMTTVLDGPVVSYVAGPTGTASPTLDVPAMPALANLVLTAQALNNGQGLTSAVIFGIAP